eukprot:616256-Pleurochrysis_carterae.AAC.1
MPVWRVHNKGGGDGSALLATRRVTVFVMATVFVVATAGSLRGSCGDGGRGFAALATAVVKAVPELKASV